MKSYRNGNPFETEAIIKKIDNYKKINELELFEINKIDNEIILKRIMNKKDKIWGLGENLGGINKRGGKYKSFCTDESEHVADKEALYGAHPFFIIDGDKRFGVFIDYPGEISFDFGNNHINEIEIKLGENFDIYIFEDNILINIVKEFLSVVGSPYIPPKWAFGYQQSKWGYDKGTEVKELLDKFRELKIPCDAIYLDIDYMDDFKIFTMNKEKFENFPKLVKYAKEKGIRFIPIVDPGIKVEKSYDLYEEGVKNNYFCKDINGEDFKAAIWPGLAHMPDFLNPKTREWWGSLYKRFMDLGIEGFWNDMNEPAFFYTPRGLNELYKSIDELRENENPGFKIFFAKMMFEKIQNSKEDFKDFYHRDKDGNSINHLDVHNLYGYYMSKATIDAMKKEYPERRPFLLSRSSYVGLQRDCGIWMGDNKSWWEHILLNMQMQISLGILGFNYTGADIGGFMSHANAELMIRWMQLAIFTPLFRNHSAIFTRNQEPWAFDEESENVLSDIIKTRYSLISFIYSEYMKASLNNEPLFKAMGFVYDDENSSNIEDQFVFGESLIVAPIYKANAKKRLVYLPEGKYLYFRLSDFKSRTIDIIKGGAKYLDINLNEIPIFLKEDSLIIFNKVLNYVEEESIEELSVLAFIKNELNYHFYEDDGIGFDYKLNKKAGFNINIKKENNDYKILIDLKSKTKINKIYFEIYDERGSIVMKTVNI